MTLPALEDILAEIGPGIPPADRWRLVKLVREQTQAIWNSKEDPDEHRREADR